MARKETPSDLMGDLLSGKKASKPASQQAGPEPSRSPQEAQEEPQKVKRTFYLSQDGLEALEELQYQLRRLARPEDRAQISYSSIVEEALLLALEELKGKGEASQLANRLA